MKKKNDLTPTEFEIMRQVWGRGRVSVREVHAALRARRPVAYTTVMTLMDKLHRKGALHREPNGKAFRYWPAVGQTEVLTEAVQSLCDSFFDGSRSELRRYLGGGASSKADVPEPEPTAQATIDVELL
ncbi:MAG: BlaI/MecI/CopY family transcriptional regulator [Acidobacteriota bacterium]